MIAEKGGFDEDVVCEFRGGLLYGFGLGVLLDKVSLVNMTSLSLLIAFLVLVPALGWLESYTHRRRVENWPKIHEQGKIIFVLTRYVLLRGAIFSVVLMDALRGRIVSGLMHEIAIPLMVVAVSFVGYQEWENCEKAFATPFGQRGEEGED